MEVGHHEIRVRHGEVQRRRGKDHTGQTTEDEGDEEAQGIDHRCFECHRPSPHRADPVKDFHPCWHRNQHGGQREEWQQYGTCDVHVVGPHGHRQRSNGNRRVDQGLVAKNGFPAEDREHLRHDSEERQGNDVDLGVAKEPEQVLPQNGPTIRGVKHMAAKHTVTAQRQHRSGQDGEGQENKN